MTTGGRWGRDLLGLSRSKKELVGTGKGVGKGETWNLSAQVLRPPFPILQPRCAWLC